MTIGSIVLKIYDKTQNKTLTVNDLVEVKHDVDEIAEKIDKIKGNKDEWYINI